MLREKSPEADMYFELKRATKTGGTTALFVDWIGVGDGVGPGFHGVGAGARGVGLRR